MAALDVLIVGAGVAGLAAARDLSAAGLDVLVVDARDRVGGRIMTHRESGFPVPVELGAEFVHGKPREVWEIIEAAALPVCDVTGESLAYCSGRIKDAGELEQIDKFFSRMKDSSEPDRTFQEFLDSVEAGGTAKAWAASYAEGFNAARRDRISVRSLVEDEKAADAIDGDRLFRITAGYDRVPLHLRDGAWRARFRLNTVVTAVTWRPGPANVEMKSRYGRPLEAVGARSVLITVPLGVLQAGEGQAGAILFRPEPPNIAAARRLEMGRVARITLRFRERFWERRAEFEELGFLHTLDAAVPTWWTALPLRLPVLTGWAAGPAAAQYAGKDREFAACRALEALARVMSISESELHTLLEGCYWHDWESDPYARGAYSYVPAGAMDARRALAAPAGNTLFFAGEATETEGHSAMVHGAIATGRRAAAEILAAC